MDNNYMENQFSPVTEQSSYIPTYQAPPQEQTPDINLPLEEIKATATYEELLEHQKYGMRPITILLYIVAISSMLAAILSKSNVGGTLSVFIGIITFALALGFSSSARKNATAAQQQGGHFVYHVFSDHTKYSYYVDDNLYSFYRIDPNNIVKVKQLRRTVVFIHNNTLFMIPKNAITNDSLLFKAINSKGSLKVASTSCDSDLPRRDKRQTAIIWLLCSAAVVFAANITVAFLAPSIVIGFGIVSFFGIGLPIVALAHIRGWKTKGKGLIIAACIVMIIALFVSFVITISVTEQNDLKEAEAKLNTITEKTGIDIPEPISCYEHEADFYDTYTKTYLKYSWLDVSISKEDNEKFKSYVEKNPIWISDMSPELEEFFGGIYTPCGQPFVITNVTEKTQNQLPTTAAKCEYIIISYDYSNNHIAIYSFSKEDKFASTPSETV